MSIKYGDENIERHRLENGLLQIFFYLVCKVANFSDDIIFNKHHYDIKYFHFTSHTYKLSTKYDIIS